MQQCHLPGVFNGFGDLALMVGAGTGNPPGHDLAPLAQIGTQIIDILIIDCHLLVDTIAAYFTPPETPPGSWFSIVGHLYSPFLKKLLP
jgi:hypothetical protein